MNLQCIFDQHTGRLLRTMTNSEYPEGAPGMAGYNEISHVVTDPEEMQRISEAATVEAVVVDVAVAAVKTYKRITVSTDKLQITANGVDTAAITAIVDDPASTENIEFYGGGVLIQTVDCVSGRAQLPITATTPGTIVVEAKSTTKYGQVGVEVQAV
ncbi:MAG: hypothetical protein WA118_08895 [Carboxydocellales bacterium]